MPREGRELISIFLISKWGFAANQQPCKGESSEFLYPFFWLNSELRLTVHTTRFPRAQRGFPSQRPFGEQNRNTAKAGVALNHPGDNCWALTDYREGWTKRERKGREGERLSHKVHRQPTTATNISRAYGDQGDKGHRCTDQTRQRTVQVALGLQGPFCHFCYKYQVSQSPPQYS